MKTLNIDNTASYVVLATDFENDIMGVLLRDLSGQIAMSANLKVLYEEHFPDETVEAMIITNETEGGNYEIDVQSVESDDTDELPLLRLIKLQRTTIY